MSTAKSAVYWTRSTIHRRQLTHGSLSGRTTAGILAKSNTGGKWTGWERSTRVPLIIVPPKHLSSAFACGETCDRPVNLIDLYPTLVELCGLPRTSPPAEAIPQLDGESLVPLLHDPNSGAERVSVTWFDRGNVSVRLNDWRYIRYTDGSEELYDHVNDPNEWHNLLPEHAAANAMPLERARQVAELPLP